MLCFRHKLQPCIQDLGKPADDAGSRLWSTNGKENSQLIQDDFHFHDSLASPHEPTQRRNVSAEKWGPPSNKDQRENLTHILST